MFLVNVQKCLRIFDSVYVSSDSENILNMAVSAGAIPIRRGPDLCGDTPNVPVYRHAMETMDSDAFIAVQANSPTVQTNLITLAKHIIEEGAEEVLTCYPNRVPYGSIWGMTRYRLNSYEDFYRPQPDVLIVDTSTDIHTREDYKLALQYA